ncbi:hypothetical protein B0H17DRAFT_1140157 [Mycena rosella]|uniref:Uncharacterized protein n=1 Tax=Mycena rosella TaxID=1033263 RepID=A0AAD7G7S5_MYCRO|nr:hypothetical protein B0H17DRAFT_1140157 [Mycena rosella]
MLRPPCAAFFLAGFAFVIGVLIRLEGFFLTAAAFPTMVIIDERASGCITPDSACLGQVRFSSSRIAILMSRIDVPPPEQEHRFWSILEQELIRELISESAENRPSIHALTSPIILLENRPRINLFPESTRIDVPAREEEHRFLTSESRFSSSRIDLALNMLSPARCLVTELNYKSILFGYPSASTTGKAAAVKKKPSNRIKTPITKAKPAKKKAAQGGLNTHCVVMEEHLEHVACPTLVRREPGHAVVV